MKKIAAIIIGVIFLFSAISLLLLFQRNEPRVLTVQDASSEVNLEIGEKIAVELTENLSTGYSRQIAIEPENILILVEDRVEGGNKKNIVGAEGKHFYVLEAAGVGTASITFNYLRPWEPDKVIESHAFNIVVE